MRSDQKSQLTDTRNSAKTESLNREQTGVCQSGDDLTNSRVESSDGLLWRTLFRMLRGDDSALSHVKLHVTRAMAGSVRSGQPIPLRRTIDAQVGHQEETRRHAAHEAAPRTTKQDLRNAPEGEGQDNDINVQQLASLRVESNSSLDNTNLGISYNLSLAKDPCSLTPLGAALVRWKSYKRELAGNLSRAYNAYTRQPRLQAARGMLS